MDDLSRQLTLARAYDIAAYAKTSSTPRLFWALDRFDFDRDTLNEDGRAQRLEARRGQLRPDRGTGNLRVRRGATELPKCHYGGMRNCSGCRLHLPGLAVGDDSLDE